MVLIDSSVWVDFFSSSPGEGGAELRRMIDGSEPLAITRVIVTEILQGLIRDAAPIERLLRQFDVLEPKGFETYSHAAAIYRAARARGITLTTIDTLITAIAIECGVPVFTLDHDFRGIARLTSLSLYRF